MYRHNVFIIGKENETCIFKLNMKLAIGEYASRLIANENW